MTIWTFVHLNEHLNILFNCIRYLNVLLIWTLSTSIYDLVYMFVTFITISSFWPLTKFFYFSSIFLILSRYSCFYLGSQHPRILIFKVTRAIARFFNNFYIALKDSCFRVTVFHFSFYQSFWRFLQMFGFFHASFI